MTILKEKHVDGEIEEGKMVVGKPAPTVTTGAKIHLADTAFGKDDLDPEKCPESHVPMMAAGSIRVACVSGNVYNFPANKIIFVQKRDKAACAGAGAAIQDKEAIAARKQAQAYAAELAKLREEKRNSLAAELKTLKAKENPTDANKKRIAAIEKELAESAK